MITVNKANPTPGEITSSLTGSTGDGAGLHFDGAAGGINLGTSMPDLGTKYSLEFVVKGDSKTGETYLLDAYKSGARIILGWSGYSNGNIQLHINGTWSSAFMATPDNGEVVHLLLSVDGTSATLYQNGNAVSTQTVVANTMTSATSTHIGCSQNGTANYFNGNIYRARFYNKALTNAEVQTAFERADVDYSSQWGSQTDLVNANSSGSGTAWTGASGVTPPNGWSAAGSSRTYTIDSSSGSGSEPALKVETGSVNVGFKWGGTAALGKKYRLSFSYKCGDAATTLAYRLTDAGSFVNLTNSTSWSHSNVVEFTGDGVTGGLMFRVNDSGKIGHFDNIKLEAIGAVVDYDLAFASPTQSRTVQDRAGAADGTATASGVTQVQPVVQLNSEELRVAGSAPKIGVGLANTVTPAGKLHVHGSDGDGYLRLSTDTTGATASDGARIGYNGSDLRIQNFENSKVQFFTNNTTEALTIASTGLITAASQVKVTSSSASTVAYSVGDAGTGWYNTGSNAIGLATNGVQRMNIANNGAVSIPGADAAASKLTVGDIHGELILNNTSGTSGSTVLSQTYNGSTAELRIGSNVSGTGTSAMNVITGDAGLVKFNGGINLGDTNLSTYAEGTWSPVFAGDSTAGTYTASSTATYTRIGNQVTVYCSLVNITESAAGSGSIKISGLPFASASGGQGYTGTSRVRQYSSAVGPFYALISPTASYVNLMYYVNGSTDAPAPLSGLSSGNTDITFTLTYFV